MTDLLITNFIDLSDEKKLMVLGWRNNEKIRKWMYHSERISKEEHLLFIDTLKQSTHAKYFLLSHNDKDIAVMYFTDIDPEVSRSDFGLYSNPSLKGLGKLIMQTICDYGFKTLGLASLRAEVFASNTRAIDLYTSFNFKQTGKQHVKNKEIIHMELSNENSRL